MCRSLSIYRYICERMHACMYAYIISIYTYIPEWTVYGLHEVVGLGVPSKGHSQSLSLYCRSIDNCRDYGPISSVWLWYTSVKYTSNDIANYSGPNSTCTEGFWTWRGPIFGGRYSVLVGKTRSLANNQI